MNQLICLISAALMVGAAIYMGHEARKLAKANQLMRSAYSEYGRLIRHLKGLVDEQIRINCATADASVKQGD